jgi:hypothetical protein
MAVLQVNGQTYAQSVMIDLLQILMAIKSYQPSRLQKQLKNGSQQRRGSADPLETYFPRQDVLSCSVICTSWQPGLHYQQCRALQTLCDGAQSHIGRDKIHLKGGLFSIHSIQHSCCFCCLVNRGTVLLQLSLQLLLCTLHCNKGTRYGIEVYGVLPMI